MAAADVIGSGSAGGLLAFCDYLVNRNLAPASAINPWKSAAKNVFSRVEKTDDFAALDVQDLDVEEYLQRFFIAGRGEYKPDSLNAYANRFTKAVAAYRGYLKDPAGWRPLLRSSPRRAADSPNSRRVPESAPAGPAVPDAAAGPVAPVAPPAEGLIDYPFPLRSGQLAHLHLPSPLDKDDADRLTQFLRSLVFERPAQISSGSDEQ